MYLLRVMYTGDQFNTEIPSRLEKWNEHPRVRVVLSNNTNTIDEKDHLFARLGFDGAIRYACSVGAGPIRRV